MILCVLYVCVCVCVFMCVCVCVCVCVCAFQMQARQPRCRLSTGGIGTDSGQFWNCRISLNNHQTATRPSPPLPPCTLPSPPPKRPDQIIRSPAGRGRGNREGQWKGLPLPLPPFPPFLFLSRRAFGPCAAFFPRLSLSLSLSEVPVSLYMCVCVCVFYGSLLTHSQDSLSLSLSLCPRLLSRFWPVHTQKWFHHRSQNTRGPSAHTGELAARPRGESDQSDQSDPFLKKSLPTSHQLVHLQISPHVVTDCPTCQQPLFNLTSRELRRRKFWNARQEGAFRGWAGKTHKKCHETMAIKCLDVDESRS